jgi:hypothetical protein
MKTVSFVTSVIAALTMALLPAQATTYTGPGTANGSGGETGIGSVVINNTISDITFTINTAAAQGAYVQYFILMQYVGQGGSGSPVLLNSAGALNGWGPSLGISTGMNAFVATWNSGANGGFTGASGETYSGGTWSNNGGLNSFAGGPVNNYVTLDMSLSSLGLSVGSQFYFDVVSSYSPATGQSAYGSLDVSTPAETDGTWTPWNGANAYDAATDTGTVVNKFGTVATEYTVVPEPATCALLGLGSLLIIIRRRASSTR